LGDHRLQRGGPGGDLLAAELDLDGASAPVGERDDRVDLLVVGVAIVTDLAVDTRGEHGQIMDDGALEQRAERIEVAP